MFGKKKEASNEAEKVKSEPAIRFSEKNVRNEYTRFFEEDDDPFVIVNRKLDALSRDVEDITFSQDLILDAINNLATTIEADKDKVKTRTEDQTRHGVLGSRRASNKDADKEEGGTDTTTALLAGGAGAAGTLAGRSLLGRLGSLAWRGTKFVARFPFKHPVLMGLGLLGYGGYEAYNWLKGDGDDAVPEKPDSPEKKEQPGFFSGMASSLFGSSAPKLENFKTDKIIRFESSKEIRFKAGRIRFEAGTISGVQYGGSNRPASDTADPMSGRMQPRGFRSTPLQGSGGSAEPTAQQPAMGGWQGNSGVIDPFSGKGRSPYGPMGGPSAPRSPAPSTTPMGDDMRGVMYPPASTTGGGKAYLSDQRRSFREELTNDPETKEKLARLWAAEDQKGGPAMVEALMNRIQLEEQETGRRPTIREVLSRAGSRQFYGPIRSGNLSHINKATREKAMAAIDEALDGSNVTKGATDQGSGSDPNVHHEGGRIRVPGTNETYNDFGGFKRGHKAAEEFRLRQQGEYERAEAAAQQGGPQAESVAKDMGNRPGVADRRRAERGEFNYSLSPDGVREFGVPGQSQMVRLKTQSGREYVVNAKVADRMRGFVNELESRGYKIGDIGGYSFRNKVGGGGLSTHATGTTIDINPSRNAMDGTNRTDMPPDVEKLAWKYGLSWGARFGDPMHFEVMSPELRQKRLEQLVGDGTISVDEAQRLSSGQYLPAAKVNKAQQQVTNTTPETFATEVPAMKDRALTSGMQLPKQDETKIGKWAIPDFKAESMSDAMRAMDGAYFNAKQDALDAISPLNRPDSNEPIQQPQQQEQPAPKPSQESTKHDLALHEMHPSKVYNMPKYAPPVVTKERPQVHRDHYMSEE